MRSIRSRPRSPPYRARLPPRTESGLRRRERGGFSVPTGVAEAARTARRGAELRHHLELHLHHRNDYQLRNALARTDGERLSAPIPAGQHQLTLVVRVDQPHEIAEHDAVAMAESGARQNKCSEPWVAQVNGKPGRNELGLAGRERERRCEARAQVESRRPLGSVGGQRELSAETRIEDAHLQRAATRLCAAHASAVPRLRAPPRAAISCAISATRPRASVSLPARPSSWRP